MSLHTGVSCSERFWSKVDRRGPDECWPWLSGLSAKGYGRLSVSDRLWLAHRFAWVLTRGPIPDGLFVCHACDNPRCCNPAHLWLGTNADNMRDMAIKGRGTSRGGTCRSGHPYDDSGAYRICRECSRQRSARYRRRLLEKAA